MSDALSDWLCVALRPGGNSTHTPTQSRAGDQCTFDYKGIGVCVEGMDDGCLVAGASLLRGPTLTCGSSSTWSTMRHQAFLYHHRQAGGTVGTQTARCFPVDPEQRVCQRQGSGGVNAKGGSDPPACLMRQGLCLETACDAAGRLSAVFKFQDSATVTLPCPTGEVVGGGVSEAGRR